MKELQLRDVLADVVINVGGDEVLVDIDGPAGAVVQYTVEKTGQLVRIQGPGDSGGVAHRQSAGGTVISQVGGPGSIQIGTVGGDLTLGPDRIAIGAHQDAVLGDQSDEREASLTITVPGGTTVSIFGRAGRVVMGDTNGPLKVDIKTGFVSAGQIASASLTAAPETFIHAAGIDGEDLYIVASGQSTVRVNEGGVTRLVARASGLASIAYGGRAATARLSASGQRASIRVAKVDRILERRAEGGGNITVG